MVTSKPSAPECNEGTGGSLEGEGFLSVFLGPSFFCLGFLCVGFEHIGFLIIFLFLHILMT